MSNQRRRYEINDTEWEVLEDLLPPERTGKPGRPSGDNRTALNGILWIAKSGAAWRDLPERYGSWSTLYDKFARRCAKIQKVVFAPIESEKIREKY